MKKTALKLDNRTTKTRTVYRPWVGRITNVETFVSSWDCGPGRLGVAAEKKVWAKTYFTDKEKAEAWVKRELKKAAKKPGRCKDAKVVTGREARKLDWEIRGTGCPGTQFVVEGFGTRNYNNRDYEEATAVWAGGVATKKVLVA